MSTGACHSYSAVCHYIVSERPGLVSEHKKFADCHSHTDAKHQHVKLLSERSFPSAALSKGLHRYISKSRVNNVNFIAIVIAVRY